MTNISLDPVTKSPGFERLRKIDEEISAHFRTESVKQWVLVEAHCNKQRNETEDLKNKLRKFLNEDEMRMVSFPHVQNVVIPPAKEKRETN